jgi:hypothetical protein
MKKKEQKIKKLQISRETLRLLTNDQLGQVAGGIDWTGCMSECTECGTIGFNNIN